MDSAVGMPLRLRLCRLRLFAFPDGKNVPFDPADFEVCGAGFRRFRGRADDEDVSVQHDNPAFGNAFLKFNANEPPCVL